MFQKRGPSLKAVVIFTLAPVYTMDNHVLGGTVGLYVRPVKYIEVYLDHAHDFNLGGGGAAHD